MPHWADLKHDAFSVQFRTTLNSLTLAAFSGTLAQAASAQKEASLFSPACLTLPPAKA